MEYDSIPYALLYEENDKPALSEISTLLSKTYVFVGCRFMWAGPQKVLFLKQPHFHMAKSHYGSWHGLFPREGSGGGGGGDIEPPHYH